MPINELFKAEILSSGGYEGGKSVLDIYKSEGTIYKLSSNENYFGSSPLALRALGDHVDQLNSYPWGTARMLYQSLKEFYQNKLDTDNFIAGNSGSGLIELITRAFLGPDTNCIISNPCFSPYKMFSSWTGSNVIDVPLIPGDFRLNVRGILNAINDQTKIIFLTSPNNPTGTYIGKSDLEELLEGLPDNILIIFDEVYYQFAQTADYTTALPYVQQGYPIVAINSFSKAYGLAGLRIGYGYTTLEISHYLRKLIRPFLINSLSLNAAIAALKDHEFIASTVSQVTKQRSRLRDGLNQLGVKNWPSQGNFILIHTPIDEHELTAKMEEHRVMVRPCGNFGAPGCVRITIGDEEATKATLSALASILKN